MPLGTSFPNSVLFVCADREGNKLPIGTAFLISHAENELGGMRMKYAVTARHVIENGAPTWLRFRGADETQPPVEVAVSEWIQHGTSDVAIAPLGLQLKVDSAVETNALSTGAFADRWLSEWRGVGERVYVIGLLSDLHSMVSRNIPMVRGGTLGALFQKDIPMRSGSYARVEPVAHLIDTQSRAGFSGAPCVLEQLSINVQKATVFPYLAVLGVVIGHFNSYVDVEPKEEGDLPIDLRVQENSRVAIVTPIEEVRNLLEEESVAEDRKERLQQFVHESEDHA
jgi:hypothetical protein